LAEHGVEEPVSGLAGSVVRLLGKPDGVHGQPPDDCAISTENLLYVVSRAAVINM
jgi:hypothetical protein